MMARSLRWLLEGKMPGPLADIVVGYLQEPIEAQRARQRLMMRELDWHWDECGGAELPRGWLRKVKHVRACVVCRGDMMRYVTL